MLYTSGTTGRPKGVMLSYDNAIISARNGNVFDKLDENEETIAYLPLAWVAITCSPTRSIMWRATASIARKRARPWWRTGARSARPMRSRRRASTRTC